MNAGEACNNESVEPPNVLPKPGTLVGNIGEPIKLSGVNIHGVTAEPTKTDQVKVWKQLSITSDDPHFYRVVQGLSSAINHFLRTAGIAQTIDTASMILLVIHPDETADLWLDKAAVTHEITLRRDVAPGTVVFTSDIGDVLGMRFPLVKIEPSDRIVCIFREEWKFGLFFDLTGTLSVDYMTKALGALYRKIKYRYLYDCISDGAIFQRLMQAGWFPFLEIIQNDFQELAHCCEDDLPLHDVEDKLLVSFTNERLERMIARWLNRPHLAGKEVVLRTAITAFSSELPVAVIKIVLTEIEGILAEAYYSTYGIRPKLEKLLKFATDSAETKAGATDTLLIPTAFARYLREYTFANFDPSGPLGSAGSRHAVGHGAADSTTYTKIRALQALLTLDQLATYT